MRRIVYILYLILGQYVHLGKWGWEAPSRDVRGREAERKTGYTVD
jgi:hypothetical protein